MTVYSATAAVRAESKVTKLFKDPLIVGASVSANYFTASPARRAALRYTSADRIATIAKNGTPGRVTSSKLTASELHGRSIIVGIDMFFWDATQADASQSLAAIERLAQLAVEAQVPLILGNVPELLPALQPQRRVINEKITSVCALHSECLMFDLDSIFSQTLRDQGIVYRGERYAISQLLPDGLHIADIASEYLADQLVTLVTA